MRAKLIYDEVSNIDLKRYGIEIPLSDRKAKRLGDFVSGLENIELITNTNPIIIGREELLLAHHQSYVDRLQHSIDEEIIKAYELIDESGRPNRYNSLEKQESFSQLWKQILRQIGLSARCFEFALESQRPCFYLGGGMHHAHSNFGHGFCIANDIVIGLRLLQQNNKIKNAWVIDVDVHKGDGTAQITQDDPTIKTLSIHMAKGWPMIGPQYDSEGNLNPGHYSSNIDLEISVGEEGIYLERLRAGLEKLSEFSRPDIAVIVWGSDSFCLDSLESSNLINLDLQAMNKRDHLLLNFLQELNIPPAFVMAGGYGPYSHLPLAIFLRDLNQGPMGF